MRIKHLNPLLWKIFLLHLALAIGALNGIAWDTGEVDGVNPWIKPLKFDLSIAIYVATMAWILRYVDPAFRRRISRGIAAAMLVETALITLQAARGVKSHFNQATPLDGAIFTVMGLAITYNTYLILRVAVRLFRMPPRELPAPALRGIQLGLVSLLVGSVMGGYMSAQAGHSVGVPDGGAGLPFLGWSTEGGDLRVAHFVGLHGIQLLLLLGAALSPGAAGRPAAERFRARLVTAAFAGYLALNLALFVRAIQGIPLP